MNIAVITGASSGIGVEYVKAVNDQFPDLQEIWIIARRKDRLEEIAGQYPPGKIVPVALDLTCDSSYEAYQAMLEEKKPCVQVLVNNSGLGKLGDVRGADYREQIQMVDVNCRALTAMATITLPYMQAGSVLLNTCSIAAYVPTPRMAVYCSTKAYVFSYSKALREEVKKAGIRVLAACPGPMDTEFLNVAGINGNSKLFDFCPRVSAGEMARKSLIKARKGRAVYTNKLIYKVYRVLCKLLPHNWIMWKTTA